MRFSVLLPLMLMALCNRLQAQLNESFTDGDFSSNPAWNSPAPADWLVNPALQLQSNNTVANSSFWISTPSSQATVSQWDFWLRLDFNPSSTNLVDVFLTASAADLTLATTTGYFVRLGNTDDEIALYRKDPGGAIVKIIDGLNGLLNSSSNTLRIRVTRNAANQWNLLRDLTATGTAFSSEGAVTDATYSSSAFFGILVRQSTASFFQRHFFDDIEVKTFIPDTTPPSITNLTATSPNSLTVTFNEPVDLTSSQLAANYTVNNGIGNPTAAVRNPGNNAQVQLNFSNPFPNGTTCQLTVNGVQDLAGNTLSNGQGNFSFYTPVRYDVVISEIMADPTPQVGLPAVEWIEIRNTTRQSFNIGGWRVGRSGSSTLSAPLPAFVLQPDSMVILCGTSAASQMQPFGRSFGLTSFPDLSSTGSLIWLQNQQGAIIHAVEYSPGWHSNALKAEGGWTLEMIDVKNPCTGAGNWQSSTNSRGGTPAQINSVAGTNADAAPPQLVNAFAIDNRTLVLRFNEPLDSSRAAIASNYLVNNGIGTPTGVSGTAPLFNQVQLQLATPLQPGQLYTVTVTNVTDCGGTAIGGFNTARVGLAAAADSLDIIINEILFDPRGGGSDYVELHNRSNKLINLRDLFLANRASNGTVANIRSIATENRILFPGDYVAITDNPANIRQEYVVKEPAALLQVSSLPSYPNDAGTVILLNAQGGQIDVLDYSDKWHFALIDNKDGIALERINPNAPTNRSDNWTSAAKTAGYGTPTAQNSQFRLDLQVQGEVTVTPEVFSPDNDGFDDFLTLNYRFPQNGYVMNVTVFDAAGRPVRALQRNTLCGQTGSFRWDGLDDKQARLPLGPYVIFTEIFNLEGKVKRFKNQVVLARRF